ncbi:CACNA1S [Symbiodinium sp. CCMP2592]|nr:CACNA1S [Symbiodinium sp. CCMP2592]
MGVSMRVDTHRALLSVGIGVIGDGSSDSVGSQNCDLDGLFGPSLADAVVDTAAEGLEVSDLNEVNEANFLADDLTDEASKVKGRSRAAWPESREVSKKSAKSQANTNRTAESSKDGRSAWSQDSRMPPYPSGRRKYLSSVDLYQALQAQQGASWPERIVTHDYFDYVMGLILMLNAILVGIQVDVASQLPSDPIWSRAIDIIFCLIFVLELVLRVSAFGQTFLNMEGWQWNLFDLLIVGFSVADEATKLILSDGEVQEVFDSFGVLRLLRALGFKQRSVELALGVGETPARPSASPAPDPTKVMRNVFPCLKLPERLAMARICRSWYRVLPPRDAEISRAVQAHGLASVIDKNWSVHFRHNDSQGWDSISVRLEYLGRSPSLKQKFRPRFVGICFGRFQIPDPWRKKDRLASSHQHEQLQQVMKKYGIRKADQGEGKFEFLKVIVGLDVLIDHIDD